MARTLSQRCRAVVEQIRSENQRLRDQDRGFHRYDFQTRGADGELVSVGPVIEAVPVKRGQWAA